MCEFYKHTDNSGSQKVNCKWRAAYKNKGPSHQARAERTPPPDIFYDRCSPGQTLQGTGICTGTANPTYQCPSTNNKYLDCVRCSSGEKKYAGRCTSCPCGDAGFSSGGFFIERQGIGRSFCVKTCTTVGGEEGYRGSGGACIDACPPNQNINSCGFCSGMQTCTPACQMDEDCVNGTCMTKCRSDQVRNATTNACECPSGYTNTDSCNNEICALDSCATGKGIKISTTDGSQSCHSGGSNACPSGLEEITFGDVTFCLGENSAGSGQYVYPDGVARSLCTGSDEMRLPGDNYTNCNTCCGSTQDHCGGICVAQCRTDQVRNTTTCACECPSGYVEQNGVCNAPANFVAGPRCTFNYEPKAHDPAWEVDKSENFKSTTNLSKVFCVNPGEKCYTSYQPQGWFEKNGSNYHGTCVTQAEENDSSYIEALCRYHCGSTDSICNGLTKNSSAVIHRHRRTITWNRKDGSASQDISQRHAKIACTTCPYGSYTNEDTNILGGGDGVGCKNLNTTCPDTKDFMPYTGNKISSTRPWCDNTCERYQGLVNLLGVNKWSKGIYWDRSRYWIHPICEISGERRGIQRDDLTGSPCQSQCSSDHVLTCTGCLGPIPAGYEICNKECLINSDGTATVSNCTCPKCTGGRIRDNGGSCVCQDSSKEWCAGTSQCVTLCTNGKVRDPSACTCGCPTGQTVQSNGNCGVTQTRVPNTGQTTLDTFGGNPAVPSGMWASSFNLQGSPAFRSVYTIGRADRPDFICWKKTTTTGAVDTILPHYFCPERQSCALGEDCPCQTVHGKEVPDTYCDYANMDPMRGYSEPEPVQGAVDHPINVGVKSITINVVPP